MKKRTATQASGKKKLKHVHIHSWFSGWRAVLPQFFSLPFFSSLFSLHFDCLLLELHTLTHTFLSFSPSTFSIIHSSYFNLFFSPPIYTNERDVWKRSSLNVNYIIARTMTMVCSRVYLLSFLFWNVDQKRKWMALFCKDVSNDLFDFRRSILICEDKFAYPSVIYPFCSSPFSCADFSGLCWVDDSIDQSG